MIQLKNPFFEEMHMNRSIVRAAQLMLVVCVAVTGISAQQRGVPAADKYKISAKAGMINYSEGLTTVSRSNGTTGTLIIGDQLDPADKVETSTGGMAEVLLNPGSYLRLGGESSFSFRTTSLDDLRLDIHSGSAILEVVASNQFKVTAFTPKGRVTIVHTGVYRIDVSPDGNGLVSVIEGKAVVGERNIALVTEGKTGTIDGGVVVVGKFDKGKRDGLATWSRSRSKDLAKMASAFNAKNTRPMIMDSLVDSFSAGVWGRSRTFGVWVFDPISRQCLFMPFYNNWTSPYGYGYSNCYCNYYMPPNIRPVDPPTRLDGRKEEGWGENEKSGYRRPPVRDSDIFSQPEKSGGRLSPQREPIFSPPPVYNPPSPPARTKPIDN